MDEIVAEKLENEASINENSETTESCNDLNNAPLKKLCPNCGALLEEDELFCHACGKNINMQTQPKKKKINLKILIPVVVAVVIIAVVGIVFGAYSKQKTMVNAVVAAISAGELDEGEELYDGLSSSGKKMGRSTLILALSDVVEKDIYVFDGNAEYSEGSALISRYKKYKELCEKIAITDEDVPEMLESIDNVLAYENYIEYFVKANSEINKPTYLNLSDDMKSLKLDTNPYDIDSDLLSYTTLLETMSIYKDVNKILGLPDSLADRMDSTTALDGYLSETYGNIRVSWKYHPDHGLEAVYELVE